MTPEFEELDWRHTPLGELQLRRRTEPRLGGREIWEVRLDEAFLMSSLFVEGEEALARLGMDAAGDGPLDVVVGGLGLGYTARAALRHPALGSLTVIERLPEVIGWHRRRLLPLGAEICADPRCRLVEGDFFALAAPGGPGLDPFDRARRFHVVLLDVDHSPRQWLHPDHAAFYRPEGLAAFATRLHPGGAFALWSNDPPDEGFVATLASVFGEARARPVAFRNPYTGGESSNTVYVAVYVAV